MNPALLQPKRVRLDVAHTPRGLRWFFIASSPETKQMIRDLSPVNAWTKEGAALFGDAASRVANVLRKNGVALTDRVESVMAEVGVP
jgi:hypothetical protein